MALTVLVNKIYFLYLFERIVFTKHEKRLFLKRIESIQHMSETSSGTEFAFGIVHKGVNNVFKLACPLSKNVPTYMDTYMLWVIYDQLSPNTWTFHRSVTLKTFFRTRACQSIYNVDLPRRKIEKCSRLWHFR